MAQKPSIPKGTRDFGQQEMAERNYIFDTIRSVFRTYGYRQIETPAMENLSTLLGKYGDEGDKLLFRILNSGDAFAGIDPDRPVVPQICEKGLRYDLTVPFARFVVQHQNEISFPFKRFQIQPVWRADRPQKGRYREFYQCDVDVVGSRSQVNELELVQIVDRVFSLLDVRVLIKVNNRKVLTGFAEICGFPERVVDITVAIDKLDKIGLEKVEEEMMDKGLSAEAVAVLRPILLLSGSTEEKLSTMRGLMNGGSASGIVSETGLKGLDELEDLFGLIAAAISRSEVSVAAVVMTISPASSASRTCPASAFPSAPTASTTSSKGSANSPPTSPPAPGCSSRSWARRNSAMSFRSPGRCGNAASPSRSGPTPASSRSSSTMPPGRTSPSSPSTVRTKSPRGPSTSKTSSPASKRPSPLPIRTPSWPFWPEDGKKIWSIQKKSLPLQSNTAE